MLATKLANSIRLTLLVTYSRRNSDNKPTRQIATCYDRANQPRAEIAIDYNLQFSMREKELSAPPPPTTPTPSPPLPRPLV
ncbi:hypothetical protein QUA40_20155, partial [Microcoleus sp. Pol11C3]|uniref:hypothetical protein n=1 Tax=Microcoleus sp. Pol11C3 TaxID=3055390 RepID=UPI002FD0AE61